MRAVLIATLLLMSSGARAQQPGEIEAPPLADRPTSGEASMLSGRTLGTGEVMIGAAAGWPWIWVQVELAPTSTFNIGIRAALLYGSSIMALTPGVGGELSLPTRIHLHGDENVDISVLVNPVLVLSEGAVTGEVQPSVFASSFGISTRLEAGGLFAIRPVERFTINVGVGAHFGFVYTPDAGGPEAVGAAWARLGFEGLISRDTLLFAEIDGGIGFAPTRMGLPVFGQNVPPLLRVSLGVGYLL
jgi:hypothetical protein